MTPKSRKLVADPHELVESQVCDLDSVTEFGLNHAHMVKVRTADHFSISESIEDF